MRLRHASLSGRSNGHSLGIRGSACNRHESFRIDELHKGARKEAWVMEVLTQSLGRLSLIFPYISCQ